jgi:hypothetical protein
MKYEEMHDHIVGHYIQNGLLEVMTSEVKKHILQKAKAAKYFALILDCTPNVSRQEQISLVSQKQLISEWT